MDLDMKLKFNFNKRNIAFHINNNLMELGYDFRD